MFKAITINITMPSTATRQREDTKKKYKNNNN